VPQDVAAIKDQRPVSWQPYDFGRIEQPAAGLRHASERCWAHQVGVGLRNALLWAREVVWPIISEMKRAHRGRRH